MAMLEITPSLSIDESEIQFQTMRASGPGGQNVNKVESAVQLRFDVRATQALTPEVKARLEKLAGGRMTAGGVLVIVARSYRTQEQNRFDAVQRFIELVQKALVEPKERKAVKRTVTASARGGAKQPREIKRTRHYNPDDWE